MSVGQLGSPRALSNQMLFDGENLYTTTTPFVTAPSSPRKSSSKSRASVANAPTSPKLTQMQLKLSLTTGTAVVVVPIGREKRLERGENNTLEREENASLSRIGSDFDFSARFSEIDGASLSPTVMSSADELFYNGKIRPLQPVQEPCLPVAEKLGSQSDNGYMFDFRKSANYDVCELHSPRSPKVHQGSLSMHINRSTDQQPYNPIDAWEQLNCLRNENQIAARDQLTEESKERKHMFVARQEMTLRQGMGARRIPRSADDLAAQTRRRKDIAKKFPKSADDLTGRGRHGKEETFLPDWKREERKRSTRITRSLSPLRVFHWEDRRRQSCESEEFFSASSTDGNDHFRDSKQSSPKKSKVRSLKEFFGMSDGRVHHRQSSRHSTESSFREKSSKPSVKGGTGRKFDDMNILRGAPQTITLQGSKHTLKSPRGAASPHELHYAQQRAQAEQMRKKTFLPYKQGVLGCLGFSYST